MRAKQLLLVICLLWTGAISAQNEEPIRIIGVGDVMLGTDFPHDDLPPKQGELLFKDVQSILTGADLTFGNLEGTITNGGKTTKNCAKCFAFRMPEYLAPRLQEAGFDVMSIANNHARDFGWDGLENTVRLLTEMDIYSAGTQKKPSVKFTKNGVRYGFAAFAPNIGMADIRDIKTAKRIVKQLAADSDIVIVSFHGGAEGAKHQHVTRKTETYYGENRGNVHAFSHAVIDAGADLVFGHGPHVTRAIEVYQQRFIAYSLGNFNTYGPFNLRGVNGVAPIVEVFVDAEGAFQKAQIHSTKQKKRDRVYMDSKQQALKILKDLTNKDFPESGLQFSADGVVTLK